MEGEMRSKTGGVPKDENTTALSLQQMRAPRRSLPFKGRGRVGMGVPIHA